MVPVRFASEGEAISTHLFPSDDPVFVDLVRSVLERLGATAHPSGLEAELRTRYPSARVKVSEPIARLGSETVWYAYRDGSARPDPADASSHAGPEPEPSPAA